MLASLIKNNRVLFKLFLQLKDRRTFRLSDNLTDEENNLLHSLYENGIAVIPNYFSAEECDDLINEFENLQDQYGITTDSDRRIFGLERLSKKYKRYSEDPLFHKIGAAYLNEEIILQTTMSGKVVYAPNNLGSGGGWHRDSYSRQFKTIVYLTDVNENNGPFQYVDNSHLMEDIKKVLDFRKNKKPNDPRFSQEEIDEFLMLCNTKITEYTAPRGTVVLADVRGLHQGKPLEQGERYAITNYFVAKSDWKKNSQIDSLAKGNYA